MKKLFSFLLFLFLFVPQVHATDYTWSVGTATGSSGSGTLSVTNASAAVVGSGTAFLTDYASPPQAISVNGTLTTVLSVTDDTNLTLSTNWTDSTQSGLSHTIGTRDWAYLGQCAAENAATSSDNVRCEVYADQIYDGTGTYENNTFTVRTTPLSTDLTAHSSARHTGAEGTGVEFTGVFRVTHDDPGEISWLELDGGDATNFGYVFDMNNSNTREFHHMIIHNFGMKNDHAVIWGRGDISVSNNLVYHIQSVDAGGGSIYFYKYSISGSPTFYNNTLHYIQKLSGTGSAVAIQGGGSATCKNNIVTAIGGAATGTPITINGCSTESNNATSDGAGTSITVGDTDQYTDGTSPGYDLSIVNSSADIVDAGTDVSGSGLTDISLDIESDSRTGTTWDIGAFEDFEAGGGSSRRSFVVF